MTQQYRALRHGRINGIDYAPGDLIKDPGAIRRPRVLIDGRFIAPAGDVAETDEGVERVDLTKWRRGDLNDLAGRAGVPEPEKLKNIPEVVAAIHAAADSEDSLQRLLAGESLIPEPELVTGYFDATTLASWTDEELVDLGTKQGIESAGDIDREELIGQLVLLPIQAPATDDEGVQS